MYSESRSEDENTNKCVACMKESISKDTSLIDKVKTTYMILISDEVHRIEAKIFQFGPSCISKLQEINAYREICLKSLNNFNSNIKKVKDEHQFETNTIKTEPIEEIVAIDLPFSFDSQDLVLETSKLERGDDIDNNSEDLDGSQFCSVCQITFTKGILEHVVNKHSSSATNGRTECNICRKTYSTKRTFYNHFKYHREYEEAKKCPKCDLHIKNIMHFLLHVKDHSLPEKLKKKENITRDNKALKVIVNKNKSNNRFICDRCNTSYTQSDRLKSHFIVKHLNGFQCKYCHRGYLDENVYKEHVRKEEGKRKEKRYVCDSCGYTGKYRAYLLEHIKKFHTPDVPLIICNECGKTFKTKNQFLYHFAARHAERKHQCTFCGKKFWYERLLTKHLEKYHSDGPPPMEECPQCKKSFDPKYVKLHIKTVHTGVRKHICQICGAGFKIPGSLRDHMHSHYGTRPYNCHLCNIGYYHRHYLKKHYQRDHGVILTTEELRKQCKQLRAPEQVQNEK